MNSAGVTLLELMIAIAVVSIVSVAIYTTYQSQVRSQIIQDVSLELQQGLRGALSIMERELRSAGSDPTGTANATILVATADEFHFNRDLTGGQADGADNDNDGVVDNPEESRYADGDTNDDNEDIRYAINANGHLGRETCRLVNGIQNCSNLQPLLDDVDALNFVYLDRTGAPIAAPVAAAQRNNIRHVQVTVVVRSAQSDRGLIGRHTDTVIYRNQQGEVILGAQNDHFRRLSISTTFSCRNLG